MIRAEKSNGTGIRDREIKQRFDTCGLTGAIRADQREDAAGRHLKIESIKHDSVVESLAHSAHADGCFNHAESINFTAAGDLWR